MLKFRTDFSDLYVITEGYTRPSKLGYINGSSFPMRQNINYQLGTAEFDVIDDPTARGGKSFHMKVLDGQPSPTRLELNWFVSDIVEDEYCIVTRMKFLSDYHLEHPIENSDYDGWHQIQNPMNEYGLGSSDPFVMHLNIGDYLETKYGLRFRFRRETSKTTFIDETVPFNVPQGWFTIKTYVKRHATDGKIKIWINDILYFDVNGIPTKESDDFYVNIAKLYGGNILPTKELWVDSVEIHDCLPTPTPVMAGFNLAALLLLLLFIFILFMRGEKKG